VKNILITLDEAKVKENGRQDVRESSNQLMATLYSPNVEAETLSTLRSLKLIDDKEIAYAAMGLHRKILFKTQVEGPYALGVVLTSIIKATKFEKAISSALGAVLKVAAGKVPLAGEFLKAAADPIAKLIEMEDDIAFIGTGFIDLKEADKGKKKLLLKIPKNDEVKTVKPPKGGASPRRSTLKLVKGKDNGHVTVNIVTLT